MNKNNTMSEELTKYFITKKSVDYLIKFIAVADKKMFDASAKNFIFNSAVICFINIFTFLIIARFTKQFSWYPIILLFCCGIFSTIAYVIVCKMRPLDYFIKQSALHFDQLLYEAAVKTEIDAITSDV